MTSSSTITALRRLRAAQKPPHGTPAYSRFVNRPLGRVLAALCYVRGATPNQVSVLSAVFTFGAITALLVFPCPGATGLAIGAAFVLGYALDSADGQLARLRGGGSYVGEWLDHMFDCLKVCSIHLAVVVHFYRFDSDPSAWQLSVPLMFAAVSGTFFFGLMLTDQLRRTASGGTRLVEGSLSVLRALAILPSDYGALAVVFFTVGWTSIFFPLYALLFLGHAALLLAAVAKWYRVLSALDASSARGA